MAGTVEAPFQCPEFLSMADVIERVRAETERIFFVVLGTTWSPMCRYTFQNLQRLLQEEQYSSKISALYVDQDAELKFCFPENIPVGFPTLLVFVNGYVVSFAGDSHAFDTTSKDIKTRLIQQLNLRQFKIIAQGAMEVMEDNATMIPCENL
jgi:hypothetical protein